MTEHPETKLHIAVIQYLKGHIRNGKHVIKMQRPFPGLMFLHPANEQKDEKEAFWASAKGALAGAPDLLFWWENKSGAIELKAGKNKLSPKQETFKYYFEEHGHKFGIAYTVAEVRDIIKSWGLECKNEACIEPKLSWEEHLRLQNELYKH